MQVAKPKKGYKLVKTSFGKYEIPEEWEYVTHADVCELINGYAYSLKEFSKTGYPIIRIQNLKGGKNFLHSNVKLPEKQFTEAGDLLFAWSATFGPFIWNGPKAAFHYHQWKVVLKDSVTKTFFYYHLDKISKLLKQTGQSSLGMFHFTKADMEKFKIPLPPLPEQKQIASILSNVDDTLQKTNQIIDQTQRLKTGMMQKLLTRGIGHTKFKKVKWYFGKEIEIPEEWEVLELRKLCKVRQGLQIPISDRFSESGVNRLPYITVKTIHSGKFGDFIENPKKRVICNENDILVTRTGNTGEIITNIKGVFHNNFFAVDFDRKIMFKDYLVVSLEQPRIQEIIMNLAGITTIPDLNHGDFFRLKITVPPSLPEQKQIASILSNVDTQIQKEKLHKSNLERLKKGLMQKLLTGQIRVKVR